MDRRSRQDYRCRQTWAPNVRFLPLVGRSGSGKTVISNFLAENYGFDACETGFMCRQVSKLVFGDEDKLHLNQVTDALQTIDRTIFLKAALRQVTHGSPVVIDSLRFLPDLEYAKSRGFRIIRILASEEKRAEWLEERGQVYNFSEDEKHNSEVELSDVDVEMEIYNNSGKDELISNFIKSVSVE